MANQTKPVKLLFVGQLASAIEPPENPEELTKTLTTLLEVEQWLNGPCATEVFEKFKIGVRFHLTEQDVDEIVHYVLNTEEADGSI